MSARHPLSPAQSNHASDAPDLLPTQPGAPGGGLLPHLPGLPHLPDQAIMPAEQCVLAVTESWLGRADSGVRRVLAHGLPSSVLYDWIMDCGQVRHQHLCDPARRDVNIPRADWDVVAVIAARGGSRGVPRKALRTVGGVPLIARAVAACRSVESITRVMVNTDCPDIAAAARAAGADVPFLRPAELATDEASPLDAWVFAQVWMLLVERRVPDFLLSVSATHPCLHPDEMRRAVDRLAAANRPALQTVAQLPAVSLEFLTPDFRPLDCEPAPAQGDGTNESGPEGGGPRHGSPEHGYPNDERFLQCGAFSITCNRPYYHVQPWFRPYMTDIPAPPAEPLAHVLSARQGVDIDEPWDLATCRLLLDGDDPFPGCTPADVAGHDIPGVENMAAPADLACVVVLPPEGPGAPDDLEHVTEPDGTHLRIAGIPAPCRVLDAVRAALPHVPLAVCGEGDMARAVARRYGLSLLPLPEFLAQRRAAWPVPLLAAGDLATGSAVWPHTVLGAFADASPDAPGCSGRDILCIDGRAALLDAATVHAFVGSARAASAPANAGCGLPACSVSPAPVHPAHLKRVDAAGSVLSAPGVPARRQDLPDVLCRDGALTLLRVGGGTTESTTEGAADGAPGPHYSPPDESTSLPYRPIPIGRAQATLVASRLDAAQGMALATHDGHPDSTPQAATGNAP
ncbi:MAG: acylneuraminate cytidylyltransferase [Desulfovibrio sp.]|jgi:hypothetical protein|nr:acylneuraminate cytidylyltransferase [Desulfovibrio sp.]